MQTISSLKEGDWVDRTFLVTAKQVSVARNGVTYLSLKLADKTGEIDGKLWDNAESVAGAFEREDFVRVKGVAANYQGSMQLKLKLLEKVADSTVDLANFLETTPRDRDEMIRQLKATAEGFSNEYLRRLMQSFLEESSFVEAFKRTPAAKTLHHNYIGGLLEHVTELVALCRDVARHFPGIDIDLLLVGAFLHDIGKVKELSVRKSIEYTTEGRLLGHISLGYEMIAEKIRGIAGFPEELAMLLKHIMLSHHGEYEFGSPKRPKIQEALIISYLDDLAAKINNFQATIRKENVAEGDWTGFSKMHDRYLYRQTTDHGTLEPHPVQPSTDNGLKHKKRMSDGSGTEKLPLDI